MTSNAKSEPLHGLILAGGKSRRMGQDKAALKYQNTPQLERVIALLQPHVETLFVAIRAAQRLEAQWQHCATIADSSQFAGPIAGLHAAQQLHPDATWLVVAVDLPLLDANCLDELLKHRRRECCASAFRHAADGALEPLCTIYESSSRALLQAYLNQGGRSLQDFLDSHAAHGIEPTHPAALFNSNTPADYHYASRRLQ